MSSPSLRLGIDMDGVLADFAGAFYAVEARVLGLDHAVTPDAPESATDEGAEAPGDGAPAEPRRGPRVQSRVQSIEERNRRKTVWGAIRSTPDFWTTVKPLEDGAVVRLHALALQHNWDVFFITRRPSTEGETVQRQTQRWLVSQGYDLPSVLVIEGSRGAAAGALRLDYHVDDSLQNCLDVQAESSARVILLAQEAAPHVRELGIAVVPSFMRCLDILEEATANRANPTLLKRLAASLGWR